MSIPGAAYDAPIAHKQYFCHQCSRPVLIPASAAAAGELSCPECRADFLEEGPTATILPFDFALMPTASSPPGSSSSSTAAPPSNLSNFITSFLGLQDAPRARSSSGSGAASAARTATPENEPESFDRLAFFQDYIRGLEESGADIQVLLDGAPVNVAPGSFIDNFDPGQDLEQLIEQIRQNRPNRQGTPPATNTALSTLLDIVATDAMDAAAECAVCKVEFSPGDGAKQMPCKHICHADCIVRWLKLHSSCPTCCFELPTHDPDSEGIKASNPQPGVDIATAAASGSSSTTEEGEQNARVVGRRFNESPPRTFGGLGGQTPQQDGNNGGADSSSQDSGSQDGGDNEI